jgi:hypothetical protein
MTKHAAFLTMMLLLLGAQFARAQPFKTGDFVEAHMFDQWLPCKVFKPELNWLVPGSTDIRSYIVTCTVNASSGPHEFSVPVTDVRARKATAEDNRVAAETAAAAARQPKGNSVGAKYGARDPRGCATRTAPAHGPPSAEQARQYTICEMENGDGIHPLDLITNLKVQVAPIPHPPNQLLSEFTASDRDPREPIWDIRGSYTGYRCFALSTLVAGNDFARTHNCWVTEQPAATGYCYKNTFGDWHCGLLGHSTNTVPNMLPPSGTN